MSRTYIVPYIDACLGALPGMRLTYLNHELGVQMSANRRLRQLWTVLP